MQTLFALWLTLGFLLVSPVQHSQNSVTNQQSTSDRALVTVSSDTGNSVYVQKKKKKKKVNKKKSKMGYRVLSHAPNLIYNVIRIGNGDRVMFCVKNGIERLPNALSYSQSSGVRYNLENKQGFEHVDFPFTCQLTCPVGYSTNKFTNKPPNINGFEIEITEPGDWIISFTN